MANVRSLGDLPGAKDVDDKRVTRSFAGGEKSGLAIENPVEGDEGYGAASRGSGEPPAGSCKVSVYKNGFKVDDGPFRAAGVPENDKFLREIQEGYAPKELYTGLTTDRVHISLSDHRQTDYDPKQSSAMSGAQSSSSSAAAPKTAVFAGEGHSLSGPQGSGVSEQLPVETSRADIEVNSAEPTLTISVRFHDGKQRRLTFNHSHSLADLHDAVMRAAPVDCGYDLLEGYPPRVLTCDPSTSLQVAGLGGGVVTQKLK
eukprot:Lankesteria_metandrocarpae@DN4511_c0_g1_i1.p2